jgi:hypothetical protein
MVPPIPSAIGAKCSRETSGDVPTVRNERRVGQRAAKVQSDSAVTRSAGKKPQPGPATPALVATRAMIRPRIDLFFGEALMSLFDIAVNWQ